MQHAPWPPAARATLGIAADRSLLIEKGDRLLQHRLGEPQLGVGRTEVVHQSCGVRIGLKQALQDPAHGELEPQVLNRRLIKEGANGLQAGSDRPRAGSDHGSRKRTTHLLAKSHHESQQRKMILGIGAAAASATMTTPFGMRSP